MDNSALQAFLQTLPSLKAKQLHYGKIKAKLPI